MRSYIRETGINEMGTGRRFRCLSFQVHGGRFRFERRGAGSEKIRRILYKSVRGAVRGSRSLHPAANLKLENPIDDAGEVMSDLDFAQIRALPKPLFRMPPS